MDRLDRIVSKFTANGVIDWQAVEEEVNTKINGIVTKENEKAVNKFLADKGFKDEKAFADFVAEHETLKTTHADMAQKQEKLSRETSLLELGITDPKMRDYLEYTIGKNVDDKTDWAKALETYKTGNPDQFKTGPITTGVRTVGAGTQPEKKGFEAILEAKHPGLDLTKK
jgi:hypothetical protein